MLDKRAYETEVLRKYLNKSFANEQSKRFLMFFDLQVECHETSFYLSGITLDTLNLRGKSFVDALTKQTSMVDRKFCKLK